MKNVEPESGALRRTRRVITAQIAVMITLLLLVVGAFAYWNMVSSQHAETDRTLQRTIGLGLSATPPGCVSLFTADGHIGTVFPGLPLRASYAGVPAGGDVLTQRLDIQGAGYTVRTANVGGHISQAVFEERYLAADRRSLLYGLAIAEGLALLVSIFVGRVLAGRAIRPLGDALRRQRTFVADASHELRAPLTRMHTRVQLLSRHAKNGPDPERFAAELDQLANGTRQLGEVVEDLLLSARLRADRPELELVELDVLADEAVAAELARAQVRGLHIEVIRQSNCYQVRGVPTALRRVLSALLDNAIGHTPPGGHIEVALAAPDERHIELSVRDNGIGFEQDNAERLFERFARGDHDEGRRFGLGLALAREVVTGHGGTIAARGTPGVGATFTLSFQRAALQ